MNVCVQVHSSVCMGTSSSAYGRISSVYGCGLLCVCLHSSVGADALSCVCVGVYSSVYACNSLQKKICVGAVLAGGGIDIQRSTFTGIVLFSVTACLHLCVADDRQKPDPNMSCIKCRHR